MQDLEVIASLANTFDTSQENINEHVKFENVGRDMVFAFVILKVRQYQVYY